MQDHGVAGSSSGRERRNTGRVVRRLAGRAAFLAGLAVLLWGGGPSWLLAQARPAELELQRFIGEADDVDALWLNPAGLGLRPGAAILTHFGFSGLDRASLGSPRQSLLGVRLGGFGFGYRHDRFDREEAVVRRRADSYTAALSGGHAGFAVGLARSWYRGGPRAAAWDVGALWRPANWLSMAAAWRDIGGVEVGGVDQPARLLAGVSLRPVGQRLTLSVQSEYALGAGELLRHDVGLRLLLPIGAELLAGVNMGADAAVQEFRIGLQLLRRGGSTELSFSSPRAGGTRAGITGMTHSAVRLSPAASPLVVGSGRIARLKLGGGYIDHPPSGFSLVSGPPAIQPILTALRQARVDPATRGLFLRIQPLAGGFIGPVTALHQELRAEMDAFRQAGKPVVAFIESVAGPAELYVAAGADEIIMPRLALVALLGVHLEIQRLGGALGRFGIGWDTLAAGEYKTAFQSLFTDSATQAQYAWIDGLVDRAFQELVDGIVAGRGLTPDSVLSLLDSPPATVMAAVAAGLIDAAGDEEAAEERIRELAAAKEFVELEPVQLRRERWGLPPAVVVVDARGPIVSGQSRRDPLFGSSTMGSRTVARQLRNAAAVRGVRAVVLRVDSPGGSAVASDEISDAVRWLREEEGLPVVASMGDMAASGGYWISMLADAIVADPLTLTGSIGVVFAAPVLEGLLDSLEVNTERWTRGSHAALLSVTRHRSAEEMAWLRSAMDYTYDAFIEGVAEGRGLPVDSVHGLAGGRVWFGRDAQRVGLVDELGGLGRAVELAAELGGVTEPYRVVRQVSAAPTLPPALLPGLRAASPGAAPLAERVLWRRLLRSLAPW